VGKADLCCSALYRFFSASWNFLNLSFSSMGVIASCRFVTEIRSDSLNIKKKLNCDVEINSDTLLEYFKLSNGLIKFVSRDSKELYSDSLYFFSVIYISAVDSDLTRSTITPQKVRALSSFWRAEGLSRS
jgi:hypothetical protein